MTLFRRRTTISCFYCLSAIDSHSISSSRAQPFDATSFRCPYCACWNRYDSHGQIIGEEPAMHDERMNADSFSRRGLPDRNHLPSLSSSRSSPFCRTCETNQTLLINLRAAYLPDPRDPSYSTRLAQLPSYIASLQSRYPLVCSSCQPTVDAEIARKDEFARTRALAGALKATSRPSSRTGFHSSTNDVKPKRPSLRIWRIRGGLWAASYITALLLNAVGALNIDLPSYLRRSTPLLPFITLASVLWTFWDPTYSLQWRSQTQGKKVRIEGRQRFILLQSLAWASRLTSSILLFCSWAKLDWDFLHLCAPNPSNGGGRKQMYFTAALILELSVLVLSYLAITIHRPMPIRLIDTSVRRALSQPNVQANNVQPEPDLFSTLSLSSNPVPTAPANPMFGQPSLAPGHSSENAPLNVNGTASAFPDEDDYEKHSAFRRFTSAQQRDPDAMDWEPATPYKNVQGSSKGNHDYDGGRPARDDGTWLRQQRFFPPEEPTGLESLLMRTRIVDEDDAAACRAGGSRLSSARLMKAPRAWEWVYGASVLPVVAILAALWLRSRS